MFLFVVGRLLGRRLVGRDRRVVLEPHVGEVAPLHHDAVAVARREQQPVVARERERGDARADGAKRKKKAPTAARRTRAKKNVLNPWLAVDGVAQPFEFRLSLGRTRLDTWEARTAWMPVACSRLLAVKPSTGAGQPKSMWHEVMGMCGGECAEIGRLVKAEMDGGGKPRNPNRPRGDSDI